MLKKSFSLLVFVCGLAAVFGIVLAASPALAQTTYYWTTTAGTMTPGDGTWDTATPNWSTTTTGDATLSTWSGSSVDTADFYANSSPTSTITVNGNQNVGNVTFEGSGYTVSGGSLAITGTITTNQDATINSVISGANGLVKSGTGALTLGGNNTQSGGLTVNSGVLTINAVQSYAGATVIISGTLNLNTAPATLPVSAGLAYRLDASNGSSVVLSGNTVTAWNDVANQVNFTACTNYATLPTYATASNGINGLAAVSFTGSNGPAGTGNNLIANQAVTTQTVFIASQPNASQLTLAGIWGQEGGGGNGIRAASNTAWLNGTGNIYGVGDFTASGGSMSLDGGPLQTGNVSFTAGQPQVLEAIAPARRATTPRFSAGTS